MKNLLFYTGQPRDSAAVTAADLPIRRIDRQQEARAYIADEGLVDAVNAMLLLGQPLLLTGEAGAGKTQLAYSIGYELGLEVLKFDTKSTSIARDMFYTYDTLGRFHAAQVHTGDVKAKDYIVYNALGLAIIYSKERSEIDQFVPDSFPSFTPRRSIVLLDEIDKAPRDFPNDLLNEVENLYFKVPQLGLRDQEIGADRERPPIIVITSNSERNLPDPFLRRCVYYNITFPDKERLRNIVLSHLISFRDNKNLWLDRALDFFLQLRTPQLKLDKQPATAELLAWLQYLRKRDVHVNDTIYDQPQIIRASLSILLKGADDHPKALMFFDELKRGYEKLY